jgi:hypothetical protein
LSFLHRRSLHCRRFRGFGELGGDGGYILPRTEA